MCFLLTTTSSRHLSLNLNDRWGIKDDRATTLLHYSLLSTFEGRDFLKFKQVYSGMLSSHLFFCKPFLLSLCTVPCSIIFASPGDLVMSPYHLNLCLVIVTRLDMKTTMLLQKAKTPKLKYLGHIKRHETLEKQIVEARIDGRRGRGRPTRRWEQDINNWMDVTTTQAGRLAEDRILFRQKVQEATSRQKIS